MFSKPHNQNLLDDVMKILGGGDKPENNIKPAPQWVVDASHGAAKTLSEAYGSGQIVTSETKRDILRKHLAEAVKGCGCNVSKEDPIYFEKEVEKRMNEGLSSRPETNKQIEEAIKSMHRDDAEAIVAGKIPEKYKGMDKASLVARAKSAIAKTDKSRAAFAADKAKRAAAQKEQIQVDMRYFLEQLTQEEVDVLTDVVLEATMSKKQLDKAVNAAFNKHFNRVQIDMMSIPKLYKEIEAGLSGGKNPDEFMPALVTKYRKN
jgi:hypothetical protein